MLLSPNPSCQALCLPTGDHAALLNENIPALTLRTVTRPSAARVRRFGVRQYLEAVEVTLRSMNNMGQRFNLSFTYYFLLAGSRFVSIGKYLPAWGAALLAVVLKAGCAWLMLGGDVITRPTASDRDSSRSGDDCNDADDGDDGKQSSTEHDNNNSNSNSNNNSNNNNNNNNNNNKNKNKSSNNSNKSSTSNSMSSNCSSEERMGACTLLNRKVSSNTCTTTIIIITTTTRSIIHIITPIKATAMMAEMVSFPQSLQRLLDVLMCLYV